MEEKYSSGPPFEFYAEYFFSFLFEFEFFAPSLWDGVESTPLEQTKIEIGYCKLHTAT